MLTDNFCRVCKEPYLYHELKDVRPGKRGICFQCLLVEYQALLLDYKKLLKSKNNGKKKHQSRRK